MNTEKFCRFCLNEIKNDTYFKNLEDPSVLDILNALNLKINLDVTKEPVMCVDCSENLQRLFTFKVICVETETRLLSFTNSQMDKKIDLLQILSKINEDESLCDKNICRFCLCETSGDCLIQLNTVTEFMQPMESFFKEIDFSSIQDPAICKDCYTFLKEYYAFIRKCTKVEETIQKYIEAENVNIDEKINLRCVQQFMDRVVLKKEAGDIEIVKHEFQEHSDFVKVKSESYMQIEGSQVDIKNESMELEEMMHAAESAIDFARREGEVGNIIKQEGDLLDEMDDRKQIYPSLASYKCSECDFEGEYGENYNKDLVIHEHRSCVKQNNGSCDERAKNCLSQHRLNRNDISKTKLLNHKNLSNIRMQGYEHEDDKTSSNVTMYKCGSEGCLHETKHKYNLPMHRLIHKDLAEVPTFKCSSEGCSYETKFKHALKRHEVIHTNFSFKCKYENCLFETKHRTYLDNHKLLHMNSSEVRTYKCGTEGCSYETIHKNNVAKHKLIHKDISEVTMHKCRREGCTYETKHRSSLSKHRLMHKDSSQVTLYKCESEGCSFETKYRNALKTHKIIHMDQSEIPIFKCKYESCSFETKRQASLKKHKLVHMNPSEVIMYKCCNENCLYETKRKEDLTAHKLIHKYRSEVTMYKCESEGCSFETKYKRGLTKHRLIHKDSSEVTMYKCGTEGCSYETKHKRCLSTHNLTHKDPSEIAMHKCGYEGCRYETKYKGTLARHKLVHWKVSKTTI